MANMTRAEMEDAQEVLISRLDDGLPITSLEHRTYNSMMMDYFNSFMDFETYATSDNEIKRARLINRLVSKVLLAKDNIVVGSGNFVKVLASDTLVFENGIFVPDGTKVVVSFMQQPL